MLRAFFTLAAAWFLSVVVVSPRPAHAFSGFLREPLSGYVKVSFDTLTSDQLFSTSGARLAASGEFTQTNLGLYAELGVHENVTVGLSGSLLRFNSFDTSEVATGVGDLTLFAKTGFEWASLHLALIGALELPTGRSEAFVETDFDQIRTNLPTGDGETNVWIRLAASRSLPTPDWLSSYVSIHGGVNIRTEFSEQLSTGAEIGFSPFGWFWLQGRIEAQFTPTAEEDLVPRGIFLFGEGTEFVAAGASASVPIPSTPFAVTLDYQNTFANLRNLYAGSTFGAGIAAEW